MPQDYCGINLRIIMAIKKVTKQKDKKVTDRQTTYNNIDKNSDLGADIRARLVLIEEILGLKQ